MSVVRFAAVRLSVAAAGAAALALGTVGAAAAAPAPAASTTVTSCKAVYKLVGTWQGKKAKHPGFTSSVRFVNTGPAAVTDWTLKLTFPDAGQKVSKVWFVGNSTETADYAQKSRTLTVTPATPNLTIPSGKSLTIALVAKGTNANPTSVTLTGTACTESASKGRVKAGIAAALGTAVEAQAKSGGVKGKTLTALRHRVAQMTKDEKRGNVKAEINHLRGFVREFHWPIAKVEVTPAAKTALLAVGDSTLASLL